MREMKTVTGNDTHLYPEETMCVAALEFFICVCVCVEEGDREHNWVSTSFTTCTSLFCTTVQLCLLIIAPPELLHILSAAISVIHLLAIPGCSRDRLLVRLPSAAARCLPPGCNLCIQCNDGLFPLCVNTATAAAVTPHTMIILHLRSLRPVGFCSFFGL